MEVKCGAGNYIPPEIDHVKIFFIQRSLLEKNAIKFFDGYEENGWTTVRGKPVKNWKTEAAKYIWKLLEQDDEVRSRYFRRSH